jgi:hypothetical protein
MLAMLVPSPAPIEAAMREGKRIRWRRRATAAAGLAVVIAAAAIVPSAVHFGAPPEPATTHRGVHYSVTMQPPGPHPSQGEIAQGTINGKPWQMTISKPNDIGQQCFESAGAAVGGHGPKICAQDTSSVPDPVGLVNFGTWYPPGQHGPARASGVIGTGTFDGNAWSVRLSLGPSGECVDFAGTPGCEPYSRPAGTAIVQYTVYGGLSSAFAVFFGSAAPAVSRIAIEFQTARP